MTVLAAGLVLFFVIHLVPTVPELRARLVVALGELPYKAAFAVASIAAFVVIVMGKAGAPYVALWEPPEWGRVITAIVMLPAFILLAGAYLPGNLKRAVPHPMLLAVVLWSIAHLLANGDLASVMLFASFGVYAVYDRVSVELRGPRPKPAHVSWLFDLLVIVTGTLAYAVVVRFHAALFSVAAIAAP